LAIDTYRGHSAAKFWPTETGATLTPGWLLAPPRLSIAKDIQAGTCSAWSGGNPLATEYSRALVAP
jgi:hypothetical protein